MTIHQRAGPSKRARSSATTQPNPPDVPTEPMIASTVPTMLITPTTGTTRMLAAIATMLNRPLIKAMMGAVTSCAAMAIASTSATPVGIR